MRRAWWRLVCAVVLLALASGTTRLQAAPMEQGTTHVVQPGESWEEIAWQYRIPLELLWKSNGVVNPALLTPGQQLFIPATGSSSIPLQAYVIGPEGSFYRLAAASDTPLAGLLLVNGLPHPIALPGQVIYVPELPSVAETPRPSPTTAIPSPSAPPPPTPYPTPPEGALMTSRLGIQGHFFIPGEDRRRLLDLIAYDLDFGWVKIQVDWSLVEYAPGQYSSLLDELDLFMDEAHNRGLRVLLSVAKAPDWARVTTEEDGPPSDYSRYYDFLRLLVLRYKYKLDAIEVWNEPNLRREWNGGTLAGAEYVEFLAGAYETIKREDARILVISAGLGPTGVNDGSTAIDDRVYLRQMYEAGIANYADAIGIHPYGWANPPWARCCGDSGGVPSHNEHPSFFFLNTIEDYRAIQSEFGDLERPLWATEFGWGTVDGLGLPVPENAPFFAYTDQGEQAEYILEAYRMAQEWDFMGPMFLWNLNVASLAGFDSSQAGYSILGEDQRPRPAYERLRDTPRVEE